MPEQNRINQIFKAIADPTRREIFHVLVFAAAALSITQLSAHFDMSRQGVTKHLKLLETAGLIDIAPSGRERYCLANPAPLQEIRDWAETYERFWDNQLGKLAEHLDSKGKAE